MCVCVCRTQAKTRLEVCLQVGVLPGELEEHRIVEELVDRHILRHALAPPRLDHELPRKVRCGGGLEWAKHNRLVQRITRHNRPVVKHLQAEGLALCVRAEVSLESERVDDGDVGLDRVEGRPWLGCVLRHVTPPARQHRVDGGDAVGWSLDLHVINRLHQARRRHQKGTISHTTRRGDDLPAPPVHGERVYSSIKDLELAVSDGLVAQRPLT
mmetsp:Transcript_46784/g.113977  ORF Transcript_46784/g.113977 Transcript_46784/m.113977 type:complete len:213 (+) Transcript_46784:441-1079(+)